MDKPTEWIPFRRENYEMSVYRRNGSFMELFMVDRIGAAPHGKEVTPRDAVMPGPDFVFPSDRVPIDDPGNGWSEAVLETSPALDGQIMYYWHIRGRFLIQGW